MITYWKVIILKLSDAAPNRIENFQLLQKLRKQEEMNSFRDYFLLRFNNECVVQTLIAFQTFMVFNRDKNIVMLKVCCKLPNLANIWLHTAAYATFYPFTVEEKHVLEKIPEDVIDGPSIVFTRKAVADEAFIQKSTNKCHSIVGIDSSWLILFLLDVSNHGDRSLYAASGSQFKDK